MMPSALLLWALTQPPAAPAATFSPATVAGDVVTFPSGALTLHGVLYKPAGDGPFPAVVYNHGSAPGMLSQEAFDALGPLFARHGWVFFGPYRRGQGLSASAGPFIGDQIDAAIKQGGLAVGAETMVRLLETDHLDDQLAALAWLRRQPFVQPHRIAAAGKPHDAKLYPPYGRSTQDGHAFGYVGSSIWADDVFRVLDRHCAG
jgi:cephalosporin-C deacetylase-like acetyl esterase